MPGSGRHARRGSGRRRLGRARGMAARGCARVPRTPRWPRPLARSASLVFSALFYLPHSATGPLMANQNLAVTLVHELPAWLNIPSKIWRLVAQGCMLLESGKTLILLTPSLS